MSNTKVQLPQPTHDDPVTYWQAYRLEGEGRTGAKDGYVCYAKKGCPSNASSYYAGAGATERAALLAARYWGNQAPWVVVVPASRAPKWALEEASTVVRLPWA